MTQVMSYLVKNNMKSIRYIALGALLVAGQTFAQNLSTEVVVDRTIQPKEHAASRLGGLTPVLVLPNVKPETLSTARFTTLSPLTRSYTRLDPAVGGRAAEMSPYKGYAAIGYFPAMNLGASAGYRFLNNDKFTLGAAFQLDGESYKPYKDLLPDSKNAQWYARLGVDFGWRPKENSQLSVELDYSYLKDKTWLWDWQAVNTIGIGADWKSRINGFDYSVGIYENFEKSGDVDVYCLKDNSSTKQIEGLTQNSFGVNAAVMKPFAETSCLGIDFNADFIHTNNPIYYGIENVDNTIGSIGVKPYYGLDMGHFTARIGIDVDFGVGDDAKVHIAPDIRLQWAASSQFGIWLNAGGGDRLNSFASRRQITNYQLFYQGFRRSNIPIILEGGFNFGPFSGFTAELYGGYAKANNWLMAGWIAGEEYEKIKGWHAGLRFGYEWNIFKASLGAEIAPSKYNKAWIYNYDKAKYVISAALDVKPIEKLSVGVGYEFRDHRGYSFDPDEWYSLGNVSNLTVHADYKILPWLTVFARGENLLGRRYDILPVVAIYDVEWPQPFPPTVGYITGGLPSQKQKGAIGVAVKF